MKVTTTTCRGFGILRFTDRYGQPCSLQESSLATEGCVWLGVDKRIDFHTGLPLPDSDNYRMHLTQQMVRDLLPLLEYFAEHGTLPVEPEESPTT